MRVNRHASGYFRDVCPGGPRRAVPTLRTPAARPMTRTDDDSPRTVRTPRGATRSVQPRSGTDERSEGTPLGVHPSSRRAALDRDPMVLSQAVRWTNRRRTRLAALLAVVGGPAVIVGVVLAATGSEGPSRVQQATAEAWAATGALSDGMRALERGDSLQPLRPKARDALAAVEKAETATRALDLGGAEAAVQRRTLSALSGDRAWIRAVSATLANPRSSRRRDLPRLAGIAAKRTAAIADDVPAARKTAGGTGRMLAASRRR